MLKRFPMASASRFGPYTSDQFFRPRKETEPFFRTVVAINGNTIGNNLIVDLWPDNITTTRSLDEAVSKRLHKFEILGTKAGELVIDFRETNQNQITAVDGLTFERLYTARASCEYGGSENLPPIYNDRTLSIIADLAETPQLPKVSDALRGSDLNTIGSTQPYTAFAAALKNAGVDSTPITIARENRELCDRAARWLPLFALRPFCPDVAGRIEAAADAPDPPSSEATRPQTSTIATDLHSAWKVLGATVLSIPSQLSDFALLSFQGAMFFLADHGYRPAKVLWWVTLTLVAFWLWFIWRLRIVAYSSKSGSSTSEHPPIDIQKLKPLGFAFLFDRMLPAYQIDSAHFEIDSYFKRLLHRNL